jgi:outer membrane protein
MKKITLIAIALVFIQCTQIIAQSEYRSALQKGSVLAGGGLSMGFGNQKEEFKYQSGSSTDETTKNSFSLNPTVGFFIANGFSLGLSVDLTSETLKDKSDDSKYTLTQYALGPVMRYYTKAGTFFFGDFAFGKAIYKSTYTGGSNEEDANRTLWKVGIGHAIFLNEHVALEPSVSYQSNNLKSKEDGAEDISSVGQVVIGLGLSIYLRKHADTSVAD